MQHIRAITLDLDDTLWAIGPVIRRAERELWSWLGDRYPRITSRYSPEAAFELRQVLVERHPDKAHDLRFLRKATLAAMAVEAGYAEQVADDGFEIFDHWRNTVDLFPDVRPALERLGTRFTLFALTNGNACLQRTGIDGYFAGLVNAEGAGVAKPDPAIFAAAVERAGVRADEVLHVGDHPEHDVNGAAEAGLCTAWVNRTDADWPGHLPRPDTEISSMTDLVALLIEPESRD